MYELKNSGHVWYNHLNEFLLKELYNNNPIYQCIFMKRSENEYVITVVYANDLNIIRTRGEFPKALNYLKKKSEMEDLGRTKFSLGLQIEYLKVTFLYIKKLTQQKH